MRTLTAERRLMNRTVFLSGSVPEPGRGFLRVPGAPFVIEQAVVALARAVFAESGRIVFGAHPSISPLVAAVAAEYFPPSAPSSDPGRLAAPPVTIYQSRVFEQVLPNETWDMFRFGFADLVWTEVMGGECHMKSEPASRCPLSLTEMRARMIAEQKPCSMIIIGGMDGVAEELALFREHSETSLVYAARETGGAAASISNQGRTTRIRILEEEWARAASSVWLPPRTEDPRELAIPPYGAMMRWLAPQLGIEPGSTLA